LTLVNCHAAVGKLDNAFLFSTAVDNNAGKNLLFTVLLAGCKDGLTGYSSSYRLCRFYDELAFFMRRRRIYLLLTGAFMALLEKTAQKKDHSGLVTDETVLKIAKEIAIKFIEVGRITPATFEQSFKNIFSAIDTTVKKG
jgi:hypothetical protein